MTTVIITHQKPKKMDSETLQSGLEYLGSSGAILSVEQKASLQSSLITLKRDNKFRRIKLWGIIKGIQQNYFIVHGVGKNELEDRKVLYSQDCINWHLLPYADSNLKAKSILIQGRFTGDPSFEYEHNVTHRVGEGETLQEQTTAIEMKEEDRLAAIVACIDEETAVVPRGAYIKTPLGEIVANKSFKGMSFGDSKRLNYYFHFRTPSAEKKENMKNNSSITQSIDFLDSIETDIPKGCWSLQCDQGGTSVILRSLIWLGMVAYHAPNSINYGYFYCGTGERNSDLLFML